MTILFFFNFIVINFFLLLLFVKMFEMVDTPEAGCACLFLKAFYCNKQILMTIKFNQI